MEQAQQRMDGPHGGALLGAEQAAAMIRSGGWFAIAADEPVLRRLPQGNWIGGTIPYFMGANGGEISREKVHVTPLPTSAHGGPWIRRYDAEHLHRICVDAPEHGYTLVILPAMTPVHQTYAREAPGFEDMFLKPVFGWVAGIHLDDINRCSPAAVDGSNSVLCSQEAVALHVPLPESQVAEIGIVNIFEQDHGDVIRFPSASFTITGCTVNGRQDNLAEYLRRRNADLRLPLVADYSGSMINVSVKAVDEARGAVELYAPVFPGVEYQLARPVGDYVQAFERALRDEGAGTACSFNCVLNFLYSDLEGRCTPGFNGPMTFGEVAYQLLNQTMVYMAVRRLPT
ncbi:MAG: hypothetical protein JJU06_09530 [Ectothiorhodospiraceae bacterium]|nr:hypothetical protein [Ectothiorhodospiraceae bacterium]MCH8503135.1 hypothetical protein [Ectothiorhodospiraceae bacterium]